MLSTEEAIPSLSDGGGALQSSAGVVPHIFHKCREERDQHKRRMGLEGHSQLGSLRVSMPADVGSLSRALQAPSMVAYSQESLITGLVRHGDPHRALSLYHKMQEDCSSHLSTRACAALLKACGKLKDIETGCSIHAYIAKQDSLETDIFLASALVSMYAKCGALGKAREVFDGILARDVVLWNAMIAAYVQHGHGEAALRCFDEMQSQGVVPDAVTFISSLKACASIGDIAKGKEIHVEVSRRDLERDPTVGNTLVDMYARCGCLAKAREVFNKLPHRDVVSWTALIAGYTQHGYGEKALTCFKQMRVDGVSPNAITLICSLKACASVGAIDIGRHIHAEISRKGLERDLIVGSTLIDMYAKVGLLANAQEVFDTLSVRDVVSWNALISGYAQHGHGEEALKCVERMHLEGIYSNAVTFIYSLKACASIGAIDKALAIHDELSKKGMETDLVVGNTLVDMYCKFGWLAKAQEVFDKIKGRNVVSWTALISGYAEQRQGEDAVKLFELMALEGISPNTVTFVCGVKACAIVGSLNKGKEMHAEICRNGLERDLVLGSTLVDMYANCGSISKAQEIFDQLATQDLVSWNALIAGYAQAGETEHVFSIFRKMGDQVKPDSITFINVLTACSHTGSVNNGHIYFEAMGKSHNSFPALEHCICMLDLVSRAGQLDKAVQMIKKMPYLADLAVWQTVLGACRKWGYVELAKEAFECALGLDERDPAAYVCMSNISYNILMSPMK